MKTTHSVLFILLIGMLPLFYACQKDTVYYSYQTLSHNEWNKKDTLQFILPDQLKADTYHLSVGIRHTNAYAYRDLWLELTQYVPKKDVESEVWVEQKDTFHIYLADEKGNWLGNGRTSSFFQLVVGCDSLTLPESRNSQTGHTLSSEESSAHPSASTDQHTKHQKKYTFLGTEKTIGAESKHIIRITHIMRDSVLMHISDIGLRLTSKQP